MKFLYAIGVRAYSFLIRIASLWNPKAKKWMLGRKEVWDVLNSWQSNNDPVYWFHCASLGEFEQGRPLIEKLKQDKKCQIVITFFSPSGYEIRKGYEIADLILYLPRETKANVRRFLDKIRPEKVFFIKYEFWATYLFEAKKRGAKLYSVAAVFREKQIFFKSYGGFMRSVLRQFDAVFVQDEKSVKLLEAIKIESIYTGDTRYDRVMENAEKVQKYPLIEKFIDGKKLLVVGSSWGEDDEILKACLNKDDFDWKVIIAPHEIGENRIKEIENIFRKKMLRFSKIADVEPSDYSILIIDNIGMLMNVYQYSDIAYVGGAFGKGLHNILEPACFGVSVIFGASYDKKFVEADDFITNGIGFGVTDSDAFIACFESLCMVDKKAEVIAFMNARVGATQLVFDAVFR